MFSKGKTRGRDDLMFSKGKTRGRDDPMFSKGDCSVFESEENLESESPRDPCFQLKRHEEERENGDKW